MSDTATIPVTLTADTLRVVNNDGTARRLAVALRSLKSAILKLSPKKILILADWLVKWTTFLERESNFNPSRMKRYKQREIVLVDFGFNIDGEFGGRHYAVILEKNNNPASNVILVAPITSYDPTKGSHPSNVDLGIGAINNYEKGASVVVNQIRAISKMRIEKPLTPNELRQYMDYQKFQELCAKIQQRINFS